MVQSSFFGSYLIRQPVVVAVASQKGKNQTKMDFKTLYPIDLSLACFDARIA